MYNVTSILARYLMVKGDRLFPQHYYLQKVFMFPYLPKMPEITVHQLEDGIEIPIAV